MIIDKFAIPDPMGWLSRLNETTRLKLISACDEIQFRAGEAIYHTDDPTGGLFTTLSGRLDVHWHRLTPGHTLVHAVGPAWWIGDLSLVTGAPRRVELIAGADSLILRLTRSQLFRIAEDTPEIHFSLLSMMASTLRTATDIIESRSMDDPVKRIAACLLRLNNTGPTWNGDLPFTQVELASIASMSRGAVITSLKTLQSKKLLENKYGKISILNKQGLDDFLEFA
jgi:CRP-like cAMP-binding protein